MTLITIHCDLVASEEARKYLWELMTGRNTPLVNELLCLVGNQLDNSWFPRGRLPAGMVKDICDVLKIDKRFSGQPSRFYTSAITLVEDIYKSFLRVQQHLRRQLEGQMRWLEILKSDEELTTLSDATLHDIRQEAQRIVDQAPRETKKP